MKVMKKMQSDAELEHYASKYYDPVKAREYYLRTRVLKGRKKAQALDTKKQKDVWAVSQDDIRKQRAEELNKESASYKTKVETARKNAETARNRIASELKSFIENLTSTQLRIPTNASPKLRALLERQHRLQSKRKQQQARKQIQKVAGDLRTTLTTARETYASNKKKIIDKYVKETEIERSNIKKKVR